MTLHKLWCWEAMDHGPDWVFSAHVTLKAQRLSSISQYSRHYKVTPIALKINSVSIISKHVSNISLLTHLTSMISVVRKTCGYLMRFIFTKISLKSYVDMEGGESPIIALKHHFCLIFLIRRKLLFNTGKLFLVETFMITKHYAKVTT